MKCKWLYVTSLLLLPILALVAGPIALAQGDPGTNVNLIGITPDPADIRDTSKRQQNEPACAIRPGDSACIICGYNDYRTVDLFNDAWQGVSMSCDGGNNWTSRIAPGHPEHAAPIDAAFAADPRVSAIPGMAVLNFIAGYRDTNLGVLAIQHWLENPKEDGDFYEPALETYIADTGSSGRFLDKPDMIAVLDPPNRQGRISLSTQMENPDLGVITRDFPTGKLYVAYAVFTGSSSVKVLFNKSDDWGRTWKNQAMKLSEGQNLVSGISLTAIGENILAVWRRAGDNNDPDSIMYSVISNGGKKATKGEVLANICQFDQVSLDGTYGRVSFRTNDFPWVANDGTNFYVFYSDRDHNGDGSCDFGRPRVLVNHSTDGLTWDVARPVDNNSPASSFQFMPAAFGANGKIQVVWYDTRREVEFEDLPKEHNFIANFGDTCGIVGCTDDPADAGLFDDPSMVADYSSLYGNINRKVDVYTTTISMDAGSLNIESPERVSQFRIAAELVDSEGNKIEGPFEADASFANKKLFGSGTLPFLGDYIAVTGREFRQTSEGKWESNASLNADEPREDFYVAWADNRDVRGKIASLEESLPFAPAGDAALFAGNETASDTSALLAANTKKAPRTGPPRDISKTAEGIEGSDLTLDVCTPGASADNAYDRTRDANIYGSLVKDRVRLFAPTPAKPLSGLQRAFVLGLANNNAALNASDSGKTYFLEIVNQPCTNPDLCRASFRQQPSHSPFEASPSDGGNSVFINPTLSNTVIVPPKSTFARTVFVAAPVDTYKVKLNAYECTGEAASCATKTLVSSVELTGAGIMNNPDYQSALCQDASCDVLSAEFHNPVLTLLNPSLINPALINPTLINMAVQAGYPENEVYDLDNPTLINPALINFILANPALINPALINPALINSLLWAVHIAAGEEGGVIALDNPALINAAVGTGYTGDILDLANPALINPALINYALANPELINPALINPALMNPALINYALSNPALINPALINVQIANPALINPALINPALINPALINPALINPALINPTLINPALINPALINPALINPTLINAAVEAGYVGDIYDLENPALINPALINFAIANPALINPALINPALINPALINPALINYSLDNPALINPALINYSLDNPTLMNPSLMNPALINSTVDDSSTGEENLEPGLTYDDYTYPVTNSGNVTTAYNADLAINTNGENVDTQLIAWTANITPTSFDCEERFQAESRVLATVNNPDLSKSSFEPADIDQPFAGSISTIATPGQTVFFTLRVFGTPAELQNIAVTGFTASSQAANCDIFDPAKPDNENYFCKTSLADERERILQADTTPPTIALPADITIDATTANGAIVDYTVSVFDANDPSPSLSCTPASGSTFVISATPHVVTCSAEDDSGNKSEGTFTVTVNDGVPPTISQGDITVTVTASDPDPYGKSVSYTPATSDNYSDVTVECTSDSGTIFDIGPIHPVTCTAKDADQNEASVTFNVAVNDGVPPTISQGDIAVTVTATDPDPDGKSVSYTPATSDNYSDVTVECTPASGTVFDIGPTHPVTCTAKDADQNEASVTFNIAVNDGVAPVLTMPADIDVWATDAAGASVTYTPTASDNFSTATVSCDPPSGSTFAISATPHVVSCTATDAAGNEASGTLTVTVNDRVDPTITIIDSDQILLEAGTSWVDPGVTAIDNFSTVTVTIAYRDELGASITAVNSNVVGTYFVDYTATDEAGNSVTTTRTVTVYDDTVPEIIISETWPDFSPEVPPFILPEGATTLTISWPVSAQDLEGISISCRIVSSGELILSTDSYDDTTNTLTTTFTYDFGAGTTSVSCTATDQGGNESLPATFDVIVEDVPTISAINAEFIVTTDEGETTAIVYDVDLAANLTVSDQLDDETDLEITCFGTAGSAIFDIGLHDVTCSVTDTYGNSASTSFKINVRFAYDIELVLDKKVAKAGSSVPLEWQYLDWDTRLPVESLNIVAGGTPTISWQKTTSCSSPPTGGQSDDGEDSGSSYFRYSAVDMLWRYNWQTPGTKGNYIVTVSPPGTGFGTNAADCVSLK